MNCETVKQENATLNIYTIYIPHLPLFTYLLLLLLFILSQFHSSSKKGYNSTKKGVFGVKHRCETSLIHYSQEGATFSHENHLRSRPVHQ